MFLSSKVASSDVCSSGVMVTTAKMFVFHFGMTWVTHMMLNAPLAVLPALLTVRDRGLFAESMGYPRQPIFMHEN